MAEQAEQRPVFDFVYLDGCALPSPQNPKDNTSAS